MKEFITVPLKNISPNKWNPNYMDSNQFNALKESVKDFKEVLEGDRIIVREIEEGQYEVIDGEHRYTALKQLKAENAPVYNLGKIQDSKAKLINLTLNNYGTEDFNRKIDLIQDLKKSIDMNHITKYIADEKVRVERVIDNERTDILNVESVSELMGELSTVKERGFGDNVFDEVGYDSTKAEKSGFVKEAISDTGHLPDVLTVEIYNHSSVRSILRLFYAKNVEDPIIILEEASKCFLREEEERLAKINKNKNKQDD